MDEILQSEDLQKVEDTYVHNIYDTIASHFSSTRYKAWPLIEQFLKNLPIGSLVADVGCGNGKYLNINPNCYFFGSDRSGNLIKICREKGFEAGIADGMHLPFKSNFFDVSISIAVIHHFASPERRLAMLKELFRIVRTGGRVLVTAWALEQGKKKYDSQDVLIPWHLHQAFTKEGQSTPKQPKQRKQRTKKSNESQNRTNSCGNESAEDSNVRPVESTTAAPTDSNIVITSDTNVNDNNNNNSNNNNNNNNSNDQSTQSGEVKEPVFQRYYHLFKKGELDALVEMIPGAKIVESVWDHENWYIVFEKQSLEEQSNNNNNKSEE